MTPKEIMEIEQESYMQAVQAGELPADPLATPNIPLRRLHRKKPEGMPKGEPMMVEAVGHRKPKEEEWKMQEEDKEKLRGLFEVGIFGKRKAQYIESDDPLTDMPTIAFRMLVNNAGVHTPRSVANFLGISWAGAAQWKEKHERFALALELGQGIQEYCLASIMARGVQFPSSILFLMKNVHGWTDKMESTQRISIAAVIANTEERAVYVDWEKPDVQLLESKVSAGNPILSPACTPISISTITPDGTLSRTPIDVPIHQYTDTSVHTWDDTTVLPVAGENIVHSSEANK